MASFEPGGDDSLRLAKDTVSTTILQKQEVKYPIRGHSQNEEAEAKTIIPSFYLCLASFSPCGLQELKTVAIVFSQQDKENLAGDAEDFFFNTDTISLIPLG